MAHSCSLVLFPHSFGVVSLDIIIVISGHSERLGVLAGIFAF